MKILAVDDKNQEIIVEEAKSKFDNIMVPNMLLIPRTFNRGRAITSTRPKPCQKLKNNSNFSAVPLNVSNTRNKPNGQSAPAITKSRLNLGLLAKTAQLAKRGKKTFFKTRWKMCQDQDSMIR